VVQKPKKETAGQKEKLDPKQKTLKSWVKQKVSSLRDG
jgi:hypothetical protein